MYLYVRTLIYLFQKEINNMTVIETYTSLLLRSEITVSKSFETDFFRATSEGS